MESLQQDLRFGWRQLRRSPGFAAVAVFTLALGIGANTAIFSVINAALLNPFPYPDAQRIMFIGETFGQEQGLNAVAYPNFLDFRQENRSFEHLAIARNQSFNLTGGEEPVRVEGAAVSAEVFPLLEMPPALGRGFRADEDREGADRVVVLSHALWERRFGGDASVIGRTVNLDEQPYTVIGVMPPRFRFWGADVWVPAGLNFDGELQTSRVARMGYFMVGRLKDGVSPVQARADLEVVARRLAAAYPDTNRDTGVQVRSLVENTTQNIRPTLLVLWCAVGFVLVIACANVANLLLARAMVREREMAIRTALGAGRWRLMRQTLLESLPLALLGGGFGLGLAFAGVKLLLALTPPGSLPSEAVVRIDWRVVLFTLGSALLTAVLFGVVPALQSSRAGVHENLKESTRGSTGGSSSHRTRNLLVIAETALALTLLMAAALLMKSFHRMQSANVGFHPQSVLQMQLNLPLAKYPQPVNLAAFYTAALERLQALPGVVSVGANSGLPFSGSSMGMPVLTRGASYENLQDMPFTQYSLVMGDYFRTLGLELRAGRVFDGRDAATTEPVVIINQTLAKKHFPEVDPIGQTLMLGLPENLNRPGLLGAERVDFPWLTVVGVVDDVRQEGFNQEPTAQAYVPYVQVPVFPQMLTRLMLVARTHGDPADLIASARQAVWSIDRDQPIARIGPMESLLLDHLRQPRFSMILLGVFASVALLLSAIGIYGVISYAVSQRTREVGIRMALGAQPADVLGLILRQGMRLVAIGLGVGLLVTLGLTRFMKSLLYEVGTADPLTLGCVAVTLATVAALACYLPARRATRVAPVVALRQD
ncbi:MAG: ABC transporter permease [Limisphaerales bacterium]